MRINLNKSIHRPVNSNKKIMLYNSTLLVNHLNSLQEEIDPFVELQKIKNRKRYVDMIFAFSKKLKDLN